jgi:hypothetical protein
MGVGVPLVRTQRFSVEGQLTEEVTLTSGLRRGSLLDPVLFLAYVNYTLGDQLIPEASGSKYLGIILRSELNWAQHVN